MEWFKSYLSDRKQCVHINGKFSKTNDIPISVLQGSILGPILFLCYINDLPGSTLQYTLLFADDTALSYNKHPDPSQQSYKIFGIWLDENLSYDDHVK